MTATGECGFNSAAWSGPANASSSPQAPMAVAARGRSRGKRLGCALSCLADSPDVQTSLGESWQMIDT